MKFYELRSIIETALIERVSLASGNNEFALEIMRSPEQKLAHEISGDPILDELNDAEVEFLYTNNSKYTVQFKFSDETYRKFKKLSMRCDVFKKISNSL